jgi:hypothetical protein
MSFLTRWFKKAPAAITSALKAEADGYRHQRDEVTIKLARYEAIAVEAEFVLSASRETFEGRATLALAKLITLYKEDR